MIDVGYKRCVIVAFVTFYSSPDTRTEFKEGHPVGSKDIGRAIKSLQKFVKNDNLAFFVVPCSD